jgi:peptidoglycan/LPS O-acetylase OafA/YrhL
MRSPTPPGPRPYYPALTGLRAVAAFAVFGFHYHDIPWFGVPWLDGCWEAVLRELHTGVSVFFTLSGFLITRRYAHQHLGVAGWGRYLLRRVARLLPVYFVLLTATLLWASPAAGWPRERWLLLYGLNLALLQGLFEPWVGLGIGQAWSLTVEEGFYLLAPLLFWLGRLFGPGRAWPLLTLAMLGMGVGIYLAKPLLGTPLFMLKTTIFGRLPEFLIGAAFGWQPAQGRSASRHRTALGGTALVVVLALLIGTQFWAGVEVSIISYPGVFLNNLVLPWATGLLIYGLATETTRLSHGLSTPVWQLLGKASYCFYLLHLGLLPQALQPWLWHWLGGGAALATLFLLLLLAAIALYFGVEKPARLGLLSLFGLRPTVKSPLTTVPHA